MQYLKITELLTTYYIELISLPLDYAEQLLGPLPAHPDDPEGLLQEPRFYFQCRFEKRDDQPDLATAVLVAEPDPQELMARAGNGFEIVRDPPNLDHQALLYKCHQVMAHIIAFPKPL